MGIETAIMAVGALGTLASTVGPMIMGGNDKPVAVQPPKPTSDANLTAQVRAGETERRRAMMAQQGVGGSILTGPLGAEDDPTKKKVGGSLLGG